MTNFTKKLTTAIATGALVMQSAMPVAFASETSLSVIGNGAGSDNQVTVSQTSTTQVNQSNDADVTNIVSTNANTGGNDANFNTGGQVTVDTGNAEVNAHVTNNLNTNVAEVENCNCAQDADVLVKGNGAFSDNNVDYSTRNKVELDQDNDADVYNNVEADANTGKNSAGFNTSDDGDVVVRTGNAKVNTGVSTTANANYARVGSNGDGGHVSLQVLENGAGSDNKIRARLTNETELDQDNDADITNKVEASANTGYNDANFNTGDGYVVIDTGNARTNAVIDNAVNFNAADVDCGCVYDLTAKIAGNGASVPHGYDSDTENEIKAYLNHEQDLDQDNDADLYNKLDDSRTNTGKNESSKNTSGTDGDPVIWTGNADSSNSIENSGNTNILGDVELPEVEMPDFDFDWNWASMFAYFSMHSNS